MERVICKYTPLACILVALVCIWQVAGHSDVCVERVTDAYDHSEGPHWDNRTQKLYFVDINCQYVRRLDPATSVVTSAYIKNGPVGVVVPVAGSCDKFVIGVGKDVAVIKWNGEQNEEVPIKVLCSVDKKDAKTRINDGKVDSYGRFWLGTMGEEHNGESVPDMGSLYCIEYKDESYILKKEISPVSISNGLAWDMKNYIFYYIDSPTRKVVAYDYDSQSGTIYNKRIVFDLNNTNYGGVPDGMTIDENGNLWIALYGGSCVINVDPRTGKVLCTVKIPAKNVTSVTFGGPSLDILYVTTSSHDLTAEERKATPYAGAVFAVKGLGVCGNPANTFRMN